jgi:hypothetical protein
MSDSQVQAPLGVRIRSADVTIFRVKLAIFNALAAVSLLLFCATVAMWVRSHSVHDHFPVTGQWEFNSEDSAFSIAQWEVPTLNPLDIRMYRQAGMPAPTTASLAKFKFMVRGERFYYVTPAMWFGVLPFFWLLKKAIERQFKLDSGRWCRKCGYDLRATPGRCPECGTIPDRKPDILSGETP